MNEEQQYLDLIDTIIKNGSNETGRNGNVRVSIGAMMRFSLENNKIPLNFMIYILFIILHHFFHIILC